MAKKRTIKLQIHPLQMLVAFLLIMLPVSLVLEVRFGIGGVNYFDEIIGILSIVCIVITAITTQLKRYDIFITVMVSLCAIIGVAGNLAYNLIDDWFPIAVDALCLFKVFLPFVVMKYIGQADKEMYIIRYMKPFAKMLILVSSFFGVINQFVYIGMGASKRYGIRAFYFIFNNEARFGYIIACCMLIILLLEKNKIKEIFYCVLCIFNMILTTKGVVYIVIVCFFAFMIMWRKTNKMTVAQTIPLGIAGTVVSTLQINTYLRDYNSPRVRFIRYGFKTANEYFPLGSGFATYGSDMAAKNYSALYYRYNFHRQYGLSPKENMFLNDCYLGMIIGQFGYIGAFIFAVILIAMFIPINRINLIKPAKAMTLSLFIGIVASSIGTAIIKSSIGVFVMAMIGLMCGYSDYNSKKEYTGTKLNIHF